MLEAALEYVIQGFSIFPVKTNKTPLTEHGLKDATMLQIGAREYWTKWPDAGIGLVTNGLVVIDFDAKNKGLESKAAMEAKYGTLPRTRTHRTGGGGQHWIYRNLNGRDVRNATALGGYQGIDLRANGGYIVVPPSIHISGNRYEILDKVEIAPAPDWLMVMATRKVSIPFSTTTDSQPISEGQRNAILTSLAGTMRRRGMPEEAIISALVEVNRLQCQPPLPEEEVKNIAKSISRYVPKCTSTYSYSDHIYYTTLKNSDIKRDKNGTENGTRAGQKQALQIEKTGQKTGQEGIEGQAEIGKNGTKTGQKTGQERDKIFFEALSKRILLWIQDTVGWWTTEELDKELGIADKSKENRRKILLRLRADGIIESHPKINKQFRYVNIRITSLAFKAATIKGILPIKWPMNIERYVNIFPGNMVVVAGSPNAGKTALLLNFIWLNQGAFPIYYLCSEMGAIELRDRLDKFPDMDINDWKFEAIERTTDFADVIRPDCINIVDYLEMTTDLFLINIYLTAISHKLGSGVAIVAVQKKQGAYFGRGQEFGMEKPKLYLSMDRGKLQIIKGKSWATKNVDPCGLQVKFKIIGGCLFEITSAWDW